ncbi:hypothetical protein HAZT_HAZT002863 [Hyalella azteca]|uniref:Uncharacterized protein n=1 Tax=Hyalella azteca TaxID=294128 RepID=A0A6A0HC76_HYAAZ|nr:hypothetical protein HAZT_HAZT002863 [Hyalella azteca]
MLCEANSRAQACGKKAYVHVVGLGLGVWRAFEEQDELFIEAWGDALRNLNRLTHIAYVDFSYIGCSSMYGTLHNEKFPGSDVVIRFSKRNLHDKVPHGCILVCNYAWDGNSLPGNEFWMDKLCSTGDSAAACSSCIAELHNHHINPAVSGQALRVAVKEGRVITWAEYAKRESFRNPGLLSDLRRSNLTVPTTNLEEVIERSKKFQETFPSETARLHVLLQSGVDSGKLEDFVHSVYPIVHHTCLNLLRDFLDHKLRFGTSPEKLVYAGMDVVSFIDRLLKKRPMCFYGPGDRYRLPAPSFKEGFGGFNSVGNNEEKYPLVMKNLLTYDEMKISALVSLSSWSWFVNDGRRTNCGRKDNKDDYQTEGVIVGQVGARFEVDGVMEYLDCLVTRQQNRPENGFGTPSAPHINAVWGKFWGGELPTYQDATTCLQGQQSKEWLAPFEYTRKRIAITAEILLCEANSRAQACGKKAYVHVVGLGLGVWRAFEEQEELYVEAWGDALRNISNLEHVAFIDFSYIGCTSIHGIGNNQKFPGTEVVIRFSKRDLHDKVPDECILVCNYTWNGNSLPGDEFWMGKMCSTGGSAAACSSCVAEIHMHSINPVVSGTAVRIATKDGQLLDVVEFLSSVQGEAPNLTLRNQFGVKLPCNSVASVSKPSGNLLSCGQESQVHGTDISLSSPCKENVWSPECNPSLANNTGHQATQSVPERPSFSKEVKPSTSQDLVRNDGIEKPRNAVGGALSSNDVALSANNGLEDVASTEEVALPSEPTVPRKIPHSTVSGLLIDNPEYKRQMKEIKKRKLQAKKQEHKAKKKESSEKQTNEDVKTSEPKKTEIKAEESQNKSKSRKKKNKNKK